MRGLNIFEDGCHVVNMMPPKNGTGGYSSDIMSMAKHRWLNAVVSIGVSAAAPTKILVNACSSNAGAGRVAIPFDIYPEETDSGDTFGPRQAVTAAGYTPSANNNIMYGIFLDAAALPDDKPWVEIQITNGTNAVEVSGIAVLTGARYHGSADGQSVL